MVVSKKVQVIRIDDGVMYVKEANIKDYIEKHDISQNFCLRRWRYLIYS